MEPPSESRRTTASKLGWPPLAPLVSSLMSSCWASAPPGRELLVAASEARRVSTCTSWMASLLCWL
jgi:hypothetical protein